MNNFEIQRKVPETPVLSRMERTLALIVDGTGSGMTVWRERVEVATEMIDLLSDEAVGRAGGILDLYSEANVDLRNCLNKLHRIKMLLTGKPYWEGDVPEGSQK